mmetsp:Transcript_14473/g.39885  ORF Transcript_14473/g.39885 Transcript_14473/m.39885 type:complete len:220 (-) Transcript_14473:1362-2021(-)
MISEATSGVTSGILYPATSSSADGTSTAPVVRSTASATSRCASVGVERSMLAFVLAGTGGVKLSTVGSSKTTDGAAFSTTSVSSLVSSCRTSLNSAGLRSPYLLSSNSDPFSRLCWCWRSQLILNCSKRASLGFLSYFMHHAVYSKRILLSSRISGAVLGAIAASTSLCCCWSCCCCLRCWSCLCSWNSSSERSPNSLSSKVFPVCWVYSYWRIQFCLN